VFFYLIGIEIRDQSESELISRIVRNRKYFNRKQTHFILNTCCTSNSTAMRAMNAALSCIFVMSVTVHAGHD